MKHRRKALRQMPFISGGIVEKKELPGNIAFELFGKVRDCLKMGVRADWEEIARRCSAMFKSHKREPFTSGELSRWVAGAMQQHAAPPWFRRDFERHRESVRSLSRTNAAVGAQGVIDALDAKEPTEADAMDLAAQKYAEMNEVAQKAEEAVARSEAPNPEPCAIVKAQIAGLPLEVVGGEWVTLRSLFEPFSKDPSKQIDRLREWANPRVFLLPSRSGIGNAGKFITHESWAIHQRDVPMAIAELDARGMSDSVHASFVRFKKECRDALADYFFTGEAKRPQKEPEGGSVDAFMLIAQMASGTAALAAKVEVAHRVADEARSFAEDAIDSAIESKQLHDVNAKDIEQLRVDLSRRTNVPRPKKPGHLFMAEVSDMLGLPSGGTGAKIALGLAKMTGATLETADAQGKPAATIHASHVEAIKPLAQVVIATFLESNWIVRGGYLVWQTAGHKPHKSVETIRPEAMRRAVALLSSEQAAVE